MADEDKMVYLEDLEPTLAERKYQAVEKKAKGALKSGAPVAPGKRQISLTDMGISAPTKRPKTENAKVYKAAGTVTQTAMTTTRTFSSRSASGSGSSSQRTVRGLPKLNSVPFSQSAYYETLTEEERRLLALELAVMGKSW
jgi:uracil-DNA glycosylase